MRAQVNPSAFALRTFLLLGCAAGALVPGSRPVFAMGGTAVPVGCVSPAGDPSTLNCSGNLSAGVNFASVTPLFDTTITMNVFDVTTNITPKGVAGISLVNGFGTAIINSNTGTHQTITTDGKPAIFAQAAIVSITHTGDIIASGFGSYGIFAAGTAEVLLSPITGPAAVAKPTVSIVSKGDIAVGTSGTGIVGYATTGDVTVTSTGNITGGHDSAGIVAANNGPDSKFGLVGLGNVTVVSKGNITLNEDGAKQTGVVPDLASIPPPYRAGIVAYNGGSGNVTVSSTGNISTTGDDRYGIDAQSAGLAAGSTVKVTSRGNVTTTGQNAGAISAIGDFANVVVDSEGDISTTGKWASGIRASSGGTANIANKGDISVTGTGSYGIYATAEFCGFCSPGGPPAGFPSDVTITSVGDINVGKAGAGIAAAAIVGDVSVKSTGNITGGAGSSGIVAGTSPHSDAKLAAPSIGDISIVSTGDITLNESRSNQAGNASSLAENLPDYSAGIVAFNGGTGAVTISSTGNISTTGNKRSGIDAYSGGFALDETLSVTSRGNITTTGNKTSGIVAESEFADVEVSSKGNISTLAESTEGIFAVSHQGGFVDVTNDGNITAPGGDSYGIMVAGYNDLTVTVKSGTVLGGLASVVFYAGRDNLLTNNGTITAGAEGIAVEGDIIGSEQIDNHGTINGNVELATEPGDDWPDVAHAGTATDNFHNFAGATFNSGALVSLGNNGLLLNEGTINPGGSGEVLETQIEGRLEQRQTGVIGIDIEGTKSDLITIKGSPAPAIVGAPATASPKAPEVSAVLAGKVAAHLVAFDSSKLTQQFTILNSAGTITNNGLVAVDTVLADYTLLYPSEHEVVLQLQANFTADGLTPNQNALLGYLGRQIGTGNASQFDQLYVTLLNQAEGTSVAAIADQLNSGAGASAFNGWLAGDAFAQALRSCPVSEGPYGQLRETSCVWARASAREFNQSAGTDRADVNSNTSGITGGIQTQVRDDVWAGVGFSLEDTTASINNRLESDGTWWQAGAVVKWTSGPWKLSGSVSGGQGNIDMTRLIVLPGSGPRTATSGTDATTVTNLARLAYSFGATGLYVTPMLDVSATYVRMDGFTEAGAGVFNLAVASADQWIFAGGPAVEVGTTVAAGGLTMRPYVKAGVTFLSEDSFDIQARFASLPAGAGSFNVASHFDDVFATVDAGVQLFSTDCINLKLDYQGAFGSDSFQNGIDAKLTVNY